MGHKKKKEKDSSKKSGSKSGSKSKSKKQKKTKSVKKKGSQQKKRHGSFSQPSGSKSTRRKNSIDRGTPKQKSKSKSKKKGIKISDLVKHNLGVPSHMSEVVTLYTGCDYNEWVAANTVDFVNEVAIIYSSIMEFETSNTV